MAAVKLLWLAAAITTNGSARADAIDHWRPLITEAAARFGVPEAWIERVMLAESRGMTRLGGRPITSPKGAMGLMQLMPTTWVTMRAALHLGFDPYDPRDNILAGAAYLRLFYDRFGYPGMFAAYNAGPGRYANHLVTGRPLPGETRSYLAQVGKVSVDPSPTVAKANVLFVRLNAPSANAISAPQPPQSGSVFAIRNTPPSVGE